MSHLLELGAIETAEAIASGKISAAEAVEARISRIEDVNPKLNAICIKTYEQARSEARAVDAKRKAGEKLPPLAGVPISLKECLDLAGTPSTFGLPSRAKIIEPKDGPHVAALRQAGAIVVGKTNVAQMLLFVETDNPLYGKTSNPWDVTRSPGGSSGGEGAILAARGAALGLGTDVGGSVRIPAHVCGITSIKPTIGRCSDPGRYSYPPAQHYVESQVGALGTRTADVALAISLIENAGRPTMGPRVQLADFRQIDVSKLKIGWYANDGVTEVCPTGKRAVKEAAQTLKSAGAQVFEWTPPAVAEAQELYYAIMTAGGRAYKDIAGSNKVDPRLGALLRTASMSNSSAKRIGSLLRMIGQGETGRVLAAFGERNTSEFWRLIDQANAYKAKFSAAMDQANNMDVMLSPGFHVPAYPHGTGNDPSLLGTHTILFNLLGYPAGVIPWTKVRPEEQSGPDTGKLSALTRKVLHASAGLPFNIQVAGRPWRDDHVLAVMSALEATARKRSDYPAMPPI